MGIDVLFGTITTLTTDQGGKTKVITERRRSGSPYSTVVKYTDVQKLTNRGEVLKAFIDFMDTVEGDMVFKVKTNKNGQVVVEREWTE